MNVFFAIPVRMKQLPGIIALTTFALYVLHLYPSHHLPHVLFGITTSWLYLRYSSSLFLLSFFLFVIFFFFPFSFFPCFFSRFASRFVLFFSFLFVFFTFFFSFPFLFCNLLLQVLSEEGRSGGRHEQRVCLCHFLPRTHPTHYWFYCNHFIRISSSSLLLFSSSSLWFLFSYFYY